MSRELSMIYINHSLNTKHKVVNVHEMFRVNQFKSTCVVSIPSAAVNIHRHKHLASATPPRCCKSMPACSTLSVSGDHSSVHLFTIVSPHLRRHSFTAALSFHCHSERLTRLTHISIHLLATDFWQWTSNKVTSVASNCHTDSLLHQAQCQCFVGWRFQINVHHFTCTCWLHLALLKVQK